MRRTRPTLPCLATLAALAGPAAASPIEITVDVTGLSGAVALPYGAHTQGASIATATDLDTYTFSAAAGDQIRVALTGLSLDFDPTLRLRDPAGTVTRTVLCTANTVSTCSLNLDQTLPTSGVYTLNVSDDGTNNAGNYNLHVDQYPPVSNWLGLAYGAAHNDALGHHSDSDYYGFRGLAGSRVNVSLQGLSLDLDPTLQVWGPDGSLLLDLACNANTVSTCSLTQEIVISSEGIYRIGTNDIGWNNVGNYRLQISCAFEPCPLPSDPAPIPGVPEPSSWWLTLAGGALLLARRRR